MTSPGFLPGASSEATPATARCAAWTEDQVDVGIGEQLVGDDGAGVASASHCMAGSEMIFTSGNAFIFSSKPFWMSSV